MNTQEILFPEIVPLTPKELLKWREDTGLSQTDFGKKVGVSRATISRMEIGEYEIPPIYRLAYLGWLELTRKTLNRA